VRPADLDARLRLAAARLGPFGGRVRHYREVRSTNDVAAELADQGAPHGTVVVADAQTAGRFRREVSPTFAAKVLYGALDEMATNWILSRRRYALAAQANEVVDLFVNGMTT